MKSVLISIQPKWVEKIANGEKTIEVRKTKPNLEMPFKCYIYQTINGGAKGDIILSSCLQCGKVIGEFTCDKVYKFICTYDGTLVAADENDHFVDNKDYFPFTIQNQTCLTRKELRDYLQEKLGYGLHISDLKIYDKPKELNEFYKPCIDEYGYCQGCKYGSVVLSADEEEYAMYHGGCYENFDTICLNRLKRPPQSWCYVEVDLE